ncbi:hypothetical protein BD413DRAFT_133875 [Trametes elegans]|nr:hypothetical protein BD413DRAFT_133875 [Trametes elegans]
MYVRAAACLHPLICDGETRARLRSLLYDRVLLGRRLDPRGGYSPCSPPLAIQCPSALRTDVPQALLRPEVGKQRFAGRLAGAMRARTIDAGGVLGTGKVSLESVGDRRSASTSLVSWHADGWSIHMGVPEGECGRRHASRQRREHAAAQLRAGRKAR